MFVDPEMLGEVLERRERNLVVGTPQRRPAHQRTHGRAVLVRQFDDHVRQAIDNREHRFRFQRAVEDSWNFSAATSSASRPTISANALFANTMVPSCRTAKVGTGIRSSNTSAGNCSSASIGDWLACTVRRRSTA